MKICKKCKKELPLEQFTKSKVTKSGYRSYCKECANADAKKTRENNLEKVKERQRLHYENNKNKYKCYYQNNKDIFKMWRINNLEKVKETKQTYYNENKQKINDYKKTHYHNNINYRLAHNLRCRIRQSLKLGIKKSKSTLKLLGCSLDDFKKHIESLWQEGMSWDNYGDWHIDHKIPCATFDLTLEENQVKCFHFSNLRPLWKIDNLSRPKFGQDLSEVKNTP